MSALGDTQTRLGVTADLVEEALKSHPFTLGLQDSYIQRLVGVAQIRNMAGGHYLWRQGEAALETFLVLAGRIDLEITIPHEGKVVIETVGAGEVTGCSALFGNPRWGFDARTVTSARLVALDSKTFRTQCAENHELGHQMLKRCSSALRKRLEASHLRLIEAHSAALP